MSLYHDVHAALHGRGVGYVVVGGTAVVLHGHLRSTVDLDLVLELTSENTTVAMEVLGDLGFLPRAPVAAAEFADAAQRDRWAREKNMQVFSLYDPSHPLREIDLFVEEPLPFPDLLRDARVVELDGVPVAVASVEHLVLLKQRAGRPQDLADIAALEGLDDVGLA